MPLQPHMKLISVDDHVIEHPQVWQDRLPAAMRDKGPKVVTAERDMVTTHFFGAYHLRAGDQSWMYEDAMLPILKVSAVAGKDVTADWNEKEPIRFDEILPGCWDPAARIKDMDADGVEAMILFPTFPRFAGTQFAKSKDKVLALECVKAWNDFIVEEWTGYAPSRFIPMMILPLWDVELAVAEIDRMVGRGARCISFPENPHPLGLPSWRSGWWDPVLAAAEANGLPLCMHFGSSGSVSRPSPDSDDMVVTATMGVNSIMSTADLLFSDVLDKFPQLRIALSEGGTGWIPWLLERADSTWERHRWASDATTSVPPSELFRQHFSGCFISDETGLRLRDVIGVDNMMWECDYPHADSNWPNSRKIAIESFRDIPDDEVHKIVEINARRLFNFGA